MIEIIATQRGSCQEPNHLPPSFYDLLDFWNTPSEQALRKGVTGRTAFNVTPLSSPLRLRGEREGLAL
jgi:hypothetical protein